MVHRENTTDDNQETLLLDIVLIQGYSCSARADFNLNKRKKRTHSVSFLASSSQRWRENCSLASYPSSAFRFWNVIVFFYAYFPCSWPLARSSCQSGSGCSIHVFVFRFKRYLLDSTTVLSALKLPLFPSFSSKKRGIILVVMAIHFPTHLPESVSFSLRPREKKITTVFLALFIHLMKKERSRKKSKTIALQLWVKYVKRSIFLVWVRLLLHVLQGGFYFEIFSAKCVPEV